MIDKKEFDISRIKEYKSSDDYIYSIQEVEVSFFSRLLSWIKISTRKILNFFFKDIESIAGFFYSFFTSLPYLIFTITFFLILKYSLQGKMRSIFQETTKSKITFETDQELIEGKDLCKSLGNAIQTKEYRIAIRFYYLLLLKKLSKSEVIVLRKEKTNKDYIKELEKSTHQSKFIESTRIYDHVWYGNFEMNASDFKNAEALFKSILNR